VGATGTLGETMNVKELIEQLQTYNPDLPVLVRIADPCGGPDYWAVTEKDVVLGYYMESDDDNERDIAAILIGDEQNG